MIARKSFKISPFQSHKRNDTYECHHHKRLMFE